MLRGLPASIILHGAVVFGGAVAWPYIAPERKVEDIVPVTLEIQLDMTTNLAPIIRRDPVPEPEVPEPEEEAIEEPVEEETPEEDEVETGEDELETTDVRELEQQQVIEEIVDTTDTVEEEIVPDVPEEETEVPTRQPDSLDDLLSDSSKLFSEVKKNRAKACHQSGKENSRR